MNAIKFEQFYKLLRTYEIFLEITQNIKINYKKFQKLQKLLQQFEEEVMLQAGISITVEKLSILVGKLHDIKDLLESTMEDKSTNIF